MEDRKNENLLRNGEMEEEKSKINSTGENKKTSKYARSKKRKDGEKLKRMK